MEGSRMHSKRSHQAREGAMESGGRKRCKGDNGDEEIDPLDAFMNELVLPEVNPNKKTTMSRVFQWEDSDSDSDCDGNGFEEELDEEEEEELRAKSKVEKLQLIPKVEHEYKPFRKNLYAQVKSISMMTPEEVGTYQKHLEVKIRGKDVPRPVKAWYQTGLTSRVLETLRKVKYESPMPIQAQALPIIMSGRDCIAISNTGSGKTLAFVLPMLRHIMDQPMVQPGEGPIGLVIAPTRELVHQIHTDVNKFAKAVGIRCVAVYGGSGVRQQINELKRGTEIIICTPGRMIDILCTKITNLGRVTYLVMDEADRMFDMGFEPQISRIVENTRPDRQTVLFSATFPRQVENLARKVLNKLAVEIQVGGRSVVNKDITQLVEVRPESERFFRVLELLGEWYGKGGGGKILAFVQTQDKCDNLFKDLTRHGYYCVSLHGGKDQADRESTIDDFKKNMYCNLMVATSVASRGLDVKDVQLVINIDVPNHYEDYVHRVGRTGRAGRKGCAITFISKDESRYAPDLVKALQLSGQVVPDDLKALAHTFIAQVSLGVEQVHGTGYGGTGFKFNEEEDEVRRVQKRQQAKQYGFFFEEDEQLVADKKKKTTGDIIIPPPATAATTTTAIAAAMQNLAKIQANAKHEHYYEEAEFEINDFPQNARWRVTNKETLQSITDSTGASITTKGQFFPTTFAGDRKLYLLIQGRTDQSVKTAKEALKRIILEHSSSFSLHNTSK